MPVFMKLLFASLFFLSLTTLITHAQDPLRLKTVVIDAGHGGKDPGAVVKAAREKDITLAVALKLGKYINENCNDVKVHYTRSTDVFIPLNDRARIANEKKADLFISIHANWISKPEISGTESFVLGLHRSLDNLEVAKKENAVIVLEEDYSAKYEGFDPNSTESYIIFELMQNAYLDQSIHMASLIENQFTQRAQRTSRGVKQAGFLVLRETAMPSVLVELGFLTNAEEVKYLVSETGQNNLASALFRAFKEYKTQFEAQSLNIQTTVASDTPKKVVAPPTTKTPIEKTSSIVYRIQVKTSPVRINEGQGIYKQFSDVWSYKDGETYKYTTFQTSSLEQAKRQLVEIRKTIADAFIVVFHNNKRITLQEALKIETGK
jgi:N-acetylmuramoyl-L-alanine amidase